jgi:hypothetical protein
MSGEPSVRNEMYIKYLRIVEVEIWSRSPKKAQTPKAFHSIMCLKRFIIQIYKNIQQTVGLNGLIKVLFR